MNFKSKLLPLLVVAGAVGTLAGCGPVMHSQPVMHPGSGVGMPGAQAQFGTVVAVEFMRAGGSNVAGTVGGAVVGGAVGNQIGGGSGNTIATIGGTVGGAMIGNSIQANANQDHFRVTIRMDNGTTRTFNYAQRPAVNVGDRVQVVGDQVFH